MLGHRCLPLLLAAVAVLLCLPALRTGLYFDDTRQWLILEDADVPVNLHHTPFDMFKFADGSNDDAQHLMDVGFLPWWTLKNIRLAFCRPVTVLTHMLDHELWPRQLWLMHLHNLLWLAALVFVAALLYRNVHGAGWVAGLAALLYAIDDGHAMPAGWIANRNGLIAAFWGLLCVLCHVRWRQSGRWPLAVVAPLFLLLGVLSNEGAIGACAYLFAYAVCLDEGRLTKRLLTILPYAVVIVGWRVTYSALGYGVWGSATYLDPVASPLSFARALIVRAPVLLLGQWALPASDIFLFIPPLAKFILWGVAVLFLGVLGYLLAPLFRGGARREARTGRFWAVGMVLAVIPASTTFPTDRLMLFAGVGAMGLLAQFLAVARAGAPPVDVPSGNGTGRGRRWRRWARRFFWVFIVLHLVLAPVLLPTRICGFSRLGDVVFDCIDGASLGEDVEDKTVIFVSAPNVFFTSDLLNVRAIQEKPLPEHIRSLAPNSVMPVPIRITREDARTLLAEPQGGYVWFLVRDNAHRFEIGDVVELAGLSIEIRSLTEKGYPGEVAFRFDKPLEDPEYVLFQFDHDTFVPFTPPGIGESVTWAP